MQLHAGRTPWRVLLPALLVALSACVPQASRPESAADRRELVEQWRVRAGVPAVVAAVDAPGRGLEVHASGSPLRGGKDPLPADGHFRIASITKTFLATVVLQLVAEGRLELDRPVRSVLPTGPSGVTVRQLLDHTSGVPDYSRVEHFTDGLISDRERVWTPTELLALVDGYSRDEPGTRYSYSNSGYLLLGQVVTAVTGRSWAQEVRGRILDPLALSDTWVAGDERPRGTVLPGYGDGDGDGDEENLETGGPWPSLETSEGAAGAMVSTAQDVARFGAALFRGRLLPAPLLAQMVTPTRFGAPNAGYGLGVEVTSPDYRTQVWGNGGFLPGFRSALHYLPEDDVVVVVLANDSTAAPADLCELLARSVDLAQAARAHSAPLGGPPPATTRPSS